MYPENRELLGLCGRDVTTLAMLCGQVTQEGKEAEDIQAVVSLEEQTVAQQSAKTAALKGRYSAGPACHDVAGTSSLCLLCQLADGP